MSDTQDEMVSERAQERTQTTQRKSKRRSENRNEGQQWKQEIRYMLNISQTNKCCSWTVTLDQTMTSF